jgi:hypothetical protein
LLLMASGFAYRNDSPAMSQSYLAAFGSETVAALAARFSQAVLVEGQD